MSNPIIPASPGATVLSSRPRTSYTFTVPPSVAGNSNPSTFTLAELSMSQEMQGNKLAEKEGPWAKVRMSVTHADGKPLDWAGGEIDRLLEHMTPPCRELVLLAFVKVHAPPQDAAESFLASMVTSI